MTTPEDRDLWERDEEALRTPGPVHPMRSEAARVARYAELIGRLYLQTVGGGVNTIEDIARAVVAVADEEHAALVAEVERLSSNLSDLLCELTGGRLSKTNYDVRTMVREVEAYFEEFAEEDRAAAVAAEAKVAKVEALADRWGAESSKTAVGIIKHGCAAELRAVLADAPAEQPWVCRHRPRCADAACSHNPAIQRWIAGEQRAEGGA